MCALRKTVGDHLSSSTELEERRSGARGHGEKRTGISDVQAQGSRDLVEEDG